MSRYLAACEDNRGSRITSLCNSRPSGNQCVCCAIHVLVSVSCWANCVLVSVVCCAIRVLLLIIDGWKVSLDHLCRSLSVTV